jgi:hypothetical protein
MHELENVTNLSSDPFLETELAAETRVRHSDALLFIAPQTRTWKVAHFRLATFMCRHKHAGGKWRTSDALLFIVPQTLTWKIARFRRTSFYRATNT